MSVQTRLLMQTWHHCKFQFQKFQFQKFGWKMFKFVTEYS